jgi:hypothetical protein
MISKKYKIRSRRGATLVSAMVAVAVILIALIGTSNFRYYSALDARKATAQTTGARIALILCESWRGIQGDQTYDPTTSLGSDLTITYSDGPENPDDFTLLGSYEIILDNPGNEDNDYNITYYATLSWKDIQPGLRALNVIVVWAQRDQGVEGFAGTDKSFSLTIYTLTI